MSTVQQAEAQLTAANDAHDRARAALQEATADLAEFRSQVKAGGSGITASDLAEAEQIVDHARLTYEGAGANIPSLAAAVKDARANEACDAVLAELPLLGQDVVSALQAIEAVLSPLVVAAERYDAFVEAAIHRLQTVAPPTEPTYEAGSGLDPQRRGGTAASPFMAGAETSRSTPNPPPFNAPASSPRATTCQRSTESA